jgi:hypothetical protein
MDRDLLYKHIILVRMIAKGYTHSSKNLSCCKFSSDVVLATGGKGDAGIALTTQTSADNTGCHWITGKFTARNLV